MPRTNSHARSKGREAVTTDRQEAQESDTGGGRAGVSLVRGGPFYRFQRSARLIGSDRWNVGRRIVFAIAVGWVPLLLMKLFFDRGHLAAFLKDYEINVRLLIVVPVLLLGEPLMESYFRRIVEHIYKARLLEATALARLDEIIEGLFRLRDAFWPELLILMLIVVRTVTADKSHLAESPWLGSFAGGHIHLTLAGWYTVLVSVTIFQFLLGLSLWRWLLWTLFAFRLSKLDLKVLATHPDKNGGLGFLGLTPLAFAPTAFGITAVIGATYRSQILYHGAHLQGYGLPAGVLAAVLALMAFGPLIFFVPRLAGERRRALLEYGVLGQIQSVAFEERWILNRTGHESELMGAPEISSLCDYGQAYSAIEEMKPLPADRSVLVGLALSVVVPALPTVVAEIPLVVVLKQLLGALK
jgi:hypothetical protein